MDNRSRSLLWLGLSAGLVILALGIWTVHGADLWNDHIEYWSAARVLADGGNPYDAGAVRDVQVSAGRTRGEPVLLYNPPWVLSIFLPLSILPYRTSALIWLLGQALIVFGGGAFLWRLYGARPDVARRGALLAALFPPTFFAVGFGQLSLVLLLALVLFLRFERDGRLGPAGAAAFLMTVKPHLLLPFGAVLLAWAADRRRRAVLVGAVVACAALSALPLLLRPGIYGEYLELIRFRPPRDFVSDTIGAGLRLLAGWERFWVQFVPALIGVTWAMTRWARNRTSWSWRDETPLLALVSAVVAPYGWFFDLVTALPAVLQLAAQLDGRAPTSVRRILLLLYLAFGVTLTTLHFLFWDPYAWVHGWVAPLLLAIYVAGRSYEARLGSTP